MIVDDARLGAYLDGALDPQARAEVDAALEADPLLAARLARLRAGRVRQSQTYDPLAHEGHAERLVANGGGRNNVVRLADRRAPPATAKPKVKLKWPAWGGLAAVFALGLVLGYAAAHENDGPLAVRADGALMARGDLVRVLNDGKTGAPGASRIGLSFRTADHRYCRIFEMDRERLAGVACREGPGWVARMTATVPPAPLKSTDTPLSVLGAVDALMAGQPLDEASEARARAHGWKD